ncbi:hypothetical protein, partial [Defluviimonas salinarum]
KILPPSLSPERAKSGRLLRRPQPDHPAATVADYCSAVLILTGEFHFREGHVVFDILTAWCGVTYRRQKVGDRHSKP